MANRKRLTLGDSKIQIFFDGDPAQYSAPSNLELATVLEEIEKWTEFVEQWVGAAEPPKPDRLMRERRELLESLKKVALFMQRNAVFQRDVIEDILVRVAASKFPNLDEEQTRELVSEFVSAL